MSNTPKSVLTWVNLARHLLAFLVASLCVGVFSMAGPTAMEIINTPATLDKPGLFSFVFAMGLFMGLFYAQFGGLFVLAGIAVGVRFGRSEWWFCALWGLLTALTIGVLFHDRDQSLGGLFYVIISGAGFLAGIVYWLIAVLPTVTRGK